MALRDLRTADGQPIPLSPAFAALLHAGGGGPAVEQRQPQIERVLGNLARAHVPCQGLYLAWDFTVVSTASLTGRLLHMRDVAFSRLGDTALAFAVSQVTDFSLDQNPLLQRLMVGTFQVPSFPARPGGPPGSRLNLGSDGLPEQLAGNVQQAQFVYVIPRSTSPQHPAHPSLYGHGLLGTPFEVEAHDVQVMAATYDFAFCVTPEIGMAQEGIPNAICTFQDFSNFRCR